MTDLETLAKISRLQPGESFVYYTGNLARNIEDMPFGSSERNILEKIRENTYQLYAAGKAALSQRDIWLNGKRQFEYIIFGNTIPLKPR